MPQGNTPMTGPGTGRLAARGTDEGRQPANPAHYYECGVAKVQVGDWCLTPGDCPDGLEVRVTTGKLAPRTPGGQGVA